VTSEEDHQVRSLEEDLDPKHAKNKKKKGKQMMKMNKNEVEC